MGSAERPRWLRLAQWVVGLAILGFAARSLVANWESLRSQPLDFRFGTGWLALSALVVWSMYAILIVAWRVMLAGWGQRLDGWGAARIWTVSSLGKYLPGKVWAVAGMALMAQRAGVAPWAATGSAVVLQVLAIGTGAAIAGVTGRRAIEVAHPGAQVVLLLLVAASIVGVGLLLWPPVLRRLLRLAAPDAEPRGAPPVGGIVLGIVANALAWVGCGCDQRSRWRCSPRRTWPASWRCSRRAASGCARACSFSCCRVRWASAPRRRWRSPRACCSR